MLLTQSQLIISIFIILFMVFNLIAVYYYKETYNTAKILIEDTDSIWSIVNNSSSYSNWWSKFTNITDIDSVVQVLEEYNNSQVKFIFKNLSSNNEVWTFTILPYSNYLNIRKQTLTNSKWQDFLNKYVRNDRDIKLFIKDLKKVQIKTSES